MVYKREKSPTKSPNKALQMSPLVAEEFHFVVPPEAPTYTPQNSEFDDPLAYIAKIRPEAEKYGICKIKPPPDWQPPFAVDVDRFKFTPRIQRLNELEASTRIKLNFLDQIAKFWELQGSSLKIPMVERRALDLYALHRFVEEEGGFYGATTNRKWSKIAGKMGFPTGRDLGSVLKHHYERILHPFDIFKQGKTISQIKSEKEENSDSDANVSDSKKKEKDYKPHGIVSRQAIKPPAEKYARRSKRCFQGKTKQVPGETSENNKQKCKKNNIKKNCDFEYDPLAKYICHNCERGDAEENMLLCDGCDDSYHTFCLLPPLTEVPKGDWRCPKCVAAEVSKPMEAFGFEQARREYTLQQFGEMADQFKSDYFNMPVHMVPSSLIEKEFWRIVSSIDEDVTVEYGADLHTMDHGSGFPTKISVEEMATCEIEYAKSRWNLNNLPCLENSVLGHINADISGMKVPWMYVGMCFATFCWHNEDHWSYSINYLHWGEAKTWYGVPGEKAEDFEQSMKRAAPELFQSQPDLLHQLVTIMNPNILMDAGVPVYRTDQEAGEFVITFPRAYHAGFNQGYNFAEAVNFAPADWLAKGRECIDHYSMLRRYCVFSHDELICKMASCPNSLDLTIAAATYQDMKLMVQTEKKLRKSLLEWGVTEAEREAFELLPDDERQCDVCKTTCFLSAVTCTCNNEQLVCLRHCTELCKCPPEKHTLRYRYTLDELPVMLEKLKLRVESYDTWCENVTNALDKTKEKVTFQELKSFLNTAYDKKFPHTDLLTNLKVAVDEAEKCATVAQQLANKKLRTRTRQTAESKYKLTMEELTLFHEEIENLSCVLKETETIKDLLEKVKDFQSEAQKLLDLESADSTALEKCIDNGIMLDVELPELVVLKHNLQRITWLEEVADTKEDEDEVTLDVLRSLLDAGVELPPHPLVEKEMACLQQLLMNVEKWEEKAKECLNSKQRQPISALEKLISEGEELPAFLPSEGSLRDALKKAKDWIVKVEAIENAPDFPYLDTLENLVNKGRHIPVKLEVMSVFESKLENAKSWKERTARTFLRKNSRYTLMEALSPRTEFGINVLKMKKKKPNDDNTYSAPVVFDVKLEGTVSPVAVVAAFKHAERQEMTAMRDLRLQNLKKRANDKGDIKYCICRRGATGFMLQCELCKDWFHAACVPLPKHTGAKTKQSPAQQLAAAATREVKFLCPCCLRSRRPRLETILSLLVSLQKLEVRLPEGEALQCLTERAMNWQDRARTSLATDEIANALAKLSVLSQKLVEAAAREKTEKIITSELKKAAGKIGNPELHRRVRAISGVSSNEDSQQSQPNQAGTGWLSQSNEDHSQNGFNQDHSQESFSERNNDETVSPLTYFSGNSEHAYSTASKTPLVKQAKQPPLVLSEIARAELEELMLEGDLLEVSLDETVHIWRILQATKPKPEKEKYPPIEQLESELIASKIEKDRFKAKQRARKRRTEEHENAPPNIKGKKYKVKQSSMNTPTIYNDLSKINVAAVAASTGKKFNKKHLKDAGKKFKTGKQMKRKLNEIEKKTLTKRKKKTERESSTDSDSDENCAAKKCLKPVGKEVDWVQCDGGCEKWYHFKCLGIDKKDIREDEDFICDGCRKMNVKRGPRHHSQQQPPQPHQSQPMNAGVTSRPDGGTSNRVKVVEPTNLDESLGLDALLSLASGLPEADNSGVTGLESNNPGWMHQQGFSYDMDVHRTFHSMPPRMGLPVSGPMAPNPPEILLPPPPPASMPMPPGSVSMQNQPHNFPMQERPPQMQNYPPMEGHGYPDKKLGPDNPQYPHYGLTDLQYSQNYNPQQPMYNPQNYQGPPPSVPPNYPVNYPPPQNFTPQPANQNYPNQPPRDFGPGYSSHHNYRYQNQSGYSEYPSIPPPPPSQQGDGYPRPNMPVPPTPIQDSYVLTQLTDSPKTNYPVQSYPISESSFNQPEYHQIFTDEGKGFEPKVQAAGAGEIQQEPPHPQQQQTEEMMLAQTGTDNVRVGAEKGLETGESGAAHSRGEAMTQEKSQSEKPEPETVNDPTQKEVNS